MERILPALLALAALLAPLAAAQEEQPPKEEPSDPTTTDPAWTEDCPPDMMCAYGGGEGSRDDGNATYGDCGAEVCAYDGGDPQPYGPDGCIECSTPPKDDGATCMDGAGEGETCDDDVQYLDGRGPADCENCRGDDAGLPENDVVSAPADDSNALAQGDGAAPTANKVPAPALAAAIVALGVAAALLVARK